MFKNCNNYCVPIYLNDVFIQPFLQITNFAPVDIYFVLQVTSKGRVKTKKSPILQRDDTERMRFPEGSTDVSFNVIKNNPPSYDFICNHVLGVPGRYCFRVVETPTGLACVQDLYYKLY